MGSYAHWIGTSSAEDFSPLWPRRENVLYIKGQKELAASGFEHWQIYLVLKAKQRLSWLRDRYPRVHWEATRSEAAREYVWKEETRIAGTQFELGELPMRRNSKKDWSDIRGKACSGDLSGIPDDVFVRYYPALKRIRSDFVQPVSMERSCVVYWGKTGVGKSHRAWAEAGLGAYSKDPLTKWWCGYRGQEHVVVDEFRG